jgi:hypothetical protein
MKQQSHIKETNHVVQIYNSSKQMIPISVKPPGGDFFLHEQTIYLKSGKTVRLPKSFLNESQISNLTTRRMIKILHDSEKTSAVN